MSDSPNPSVHLRSSTLVWLRRIGIALFSVTILATATAFVIVRYYEDDVVKYAIERINDRLATKASVAEVDLTFWETFPHTSLRFTNVYVQESLPEKDTLLYAEKLYLEFSLMDLFRGDYTIREISVDNGQLALRTTPTGQNNWSIWKTQTDSTALKMNLEAVKAQDFLFSIENAQDRFYCALELNNLEASGAFQQSSFNLSLQADSRVQSLYQGTTEYLFGTAVKADVDIQANTSNQSYRCSKGNIQMNALKFTLTGGIQQGSSIDILISGDEIDLEALLSSLPSEYAQPIKAYKAEGNITTTIEIKGSVDQPDVTASFSIIDGSVTHRQSGTSLNSIQLSGLYRKPLKGKDSVKIERASGQLETGSFTLNGQLTDLASPTADLHINTQTELRDLRNFFAWDTLEICEGHIDASAHIKGSLKYVEMDSTMDWSAVQSTGSAKLNNARFKLKGSSRDFQSISGQVELSNKTASIKHFQGTVNGSDFSLSGNVDNLLSFLTNPRERLLIHASFKSNTILFDQLVETDTHAANSSAEGQDYVFQLPERIDGTLETNVTSFHFRSFLAEDIRGNIHLLNGSLRIDPVSFRTANGNFGAQLSMYPIGKDHYKVTSRAQLKSIDIRELFKQFENFGQSFITDANLRGTTTATVQLELPLSRSLQIDDQQLVALIDIAIDNGQLIGLSSLQELALYLKTNKWAAPFVNTDLLADKLKDIRFSKLENVIEIRNRTISFPQMDIRSSAMDIIAQGRHNFDNRIDYTIGFRLRDILIQREHTDETDDGLGRQIFVYMRGTTDDPEFGIDKEAAKESRKLAIQNEKQNVKALLKEEFGLFKNDASVGSYKEKEQTRQSTTTIEWEGYQSTTTSSGTKPTPVPNKPSKPAENTPSEDKAPKKKVPRWLQEKPDEVKSSQP